uniref:Uncharacterized protein n=1 Tax=Oryza nivara TaxID=4536 RepID=A0A0E0GIL2_ORYNI
MPFLSIKAAAAAQREQASDKLRQEGEKNSSTRPAGGGEEVAEARRSDSRPVMWRRRRRGGGDTGEGEGVGRARRRWRASALAERRWQLQREGGGGDTQVPLPHARVQETVAASYDNLVAAAHGFLAREGHINFSVSAAFPASPHQLRSKCNKKLVFQIKFQKKKWRYQVSYSNTRQSSRENDAKDQVTLTGTSEAPSGRSAQEDNSEQTGLFASLQSADANPHDIYSSLVREGLFDTGDEILSMDTGESADTPISGLASGLANLGTADPAERGYSINETTNEEGYLIEGDDPSPSNKDEQDDQTDAHGESTPEAQSHKMAAPSSPAAAHLRHRAPPPRFSPSSPSADSILAAFVTCCRRRRRHAQQWDGGEEASQGTILPRSGRRPAGAPRRRRLGPVVVVLILVVGALFLNLGPTGSSSFTMPWIRMEFNEPVHVAVAAPPPPLTQMQAGVNTSGEDLRPTTSASALTARSSCSTSSRRRASPPGSTPDPSPSAARVSNLSHSSPRKLGRTLGPVAVSCGSCEFFRSSWVGLMASWMCRAADQARSLASLVASINSPRRRRPSLCWSWHH